MKRPPRALLKGLAALAAVPLAPLSSSCWPGWDFLFDQTPSREHRLEDLRVLGAALEPAAVAVPPALVLADAAEPPPLELTVRPFVFDPRGGDVEIGVRLCAHADPFLPCVPTAADVPSFGGSFPADASDPLGRVDVVTTLALDRAAVRALYAEAGVEPLSLQTVALDVVMDVSRTVDGRRERESAVLAVMMTLDAFGRGLPGDVRDAVLAEANAIDCTGLENDGCFPRLLDYPVEPICGDLILEFGEQCDPPDGATCDERCQALDVCFAELSPVCLQPLKNARPQLAGLRITEQSAFPTDEPPDVLPGEVIRVAPAQSVFVMPAGTEALIESYQTSFPQGCPPDSPAGAVTLSCGHLELVSWRAYVLDGAAELTAPVDETGAYVGNVPGGFSDTGFAAPVGVSFRDGTAAGTREPLIVVLADGRGGMDLQVFTLEAE